jgi:hypothetical protein
MTSNDIEWHRMTAFCPRNVGSAVHDAPSYHISWKHRRLVLGICCCNTSDNFRLSWKRPSKIRLCSSKAARQSWRNVSSRRNSRESANGSPKCKVGVNSHERAFFGGCNVQFHCKHVLNKYLFRSSEPFHLITDCRVKHLPETYSLPQYRGRPSLTKLSCRKNRWYGWENGNKLPRNYKQILRRYKNNCMIIELSNTDSQVPPKKSANKWFWSKLECPARLLGGQSHILAKLRDLKSKVWWA